MNASPPAAARLLQQLDDIEAKLAGLHEAIARSAGPQIAPAVTAVTAARWISA